MNVVDEVNVGRQMRENAFAPVGAVARENDLVVGVPLGHQLDELEGQLGSSAMIGIGLGGSAPTLLSLGKSLSIAVQPLLTIEQGENFRGSALKGFTMIRQCTTQSLSPTDKAWLN